MKWLLSLVFVLVSLAGSSQLSSDKYVALARQDLKEQNYTIAIQRLNFAIRAKPYNVEAYFLRAVAKYSLEDYKGAVIDYSHCLSISPNNPTVYQNRGLCRARMNDHYAALEDFDRAIKLDPGNYFCYINKAYSLLQTSQYEDAVKACDRALTLNNYLGDVFLLKGMALYELKENEKAIENFTRALEIDPNYSEAYLRRAMALVANLEYDKALADCDTAISVDSISSVGYFVKANIYAEQLKYDKAIENYDRVIELSPNNAKAYFNRASLETKMDNYSKAAYDYKRVTEINPENILAHFNLALTYHKLERYDLAVKSYDKVIELYEDYEDAWFNRAFVKKELGDEKGAALDFQKGNEIRARNRLKTFDAEERALLEKRTKMSDDFYRPSFSEEEEKIAIYTFPYFEIKETDYKSINNTYLYYNIRSLTDYNEEHKNLPFFYISNPIMMGDSLRLSPAVDQENSDYGLMQKAITYKSAFNYNEAIATYDTLIALYPDFALGYFNKASTMLDLLELMLKLEAGEGNFIDMGEEITPMNLKDIETVNLQLKAIEELYLKSIDLAPEFYYTWFNIGIVRAEQRNFEGSLEAYEKVIKINPQFAEAYYNKGLTHLYLENTKKACNDLSKAGELGIDDAYEVMKRYCK